MKEKASNLPLTLESSTSDSTARPLHETQLRSQISTDLDFDGTALGASNLPAVLESTKVPPVFGHTKNVRADRDKLNKKQGQKETSERNNKRLNNINNEQKEGPIFGIRASKNQPNQV